MLNAYSDRSWTPIPIQDEHSFRREDEHFCLTEQYVALLATEGVKLSFSDSGIRRIAEVSWQVNDQTENIGARRLYTVMERLLETISYEASDKSGEEYVVDSDYVDANLLELVKDQDLSRFIL